MCNTIRVSDSNVSLDGVLLLAKLLLEMHHVHCEILGRRSHGNSLGAHRKCRGAGLAANIAVHITIAQDVFDSLLAREQVAINIFDV